MRLVLLAMTLTTLSLVPAGASASCAAPDLRVGGSWEGVVLVPGQAVVVEGRAFVEGCDDTGGGDAFGCSRAEEEREVPYADVLLELRQGSRVWELDAEDASTTPGSVGRVEWDVTVPEGVRPGEARLVATAPRLGEPAVLRVTVAEGLPPDPPPLQDPTVSPLPGY